MKRFVMAIVCMAMTFSVAMAQVKQKKTPTIKYVNATSLTLLGKLSPSQNPYHRVETADYPQMTKTEAWLLRQSSGLAIAFRTDATEIWVKAKYGPCSTWHSQAPLTSTTGFNLFMKDENGEWLWASSKAHKIIPMKNRLDLLSKPLCIINGLAKGGKECIIYLPLFSELTEVEIGVPEGAEIAEMPNPFRHTIAVFGSSFTHGSASSGAGLTWPAFLSRATGLYMCSYGMSGNSKLQEYMGDILGKTKADAYICDSFSNPNIQTIGERIRPFIEAIRKHNADAPIIFINTIYREYRNFVPAIEKKEQGRIEYVEKIMKSIVKEYKNVYFVNVPNQTGTDHVTSADGTHPYSYGYHRWAQAIEKPIVKILKKHKIK